MVVGGDDSWIKSFILFLWHSDVRRMFNLNKYFPIKPIHQLVIKLLTLLLALTFISTLSTYPNLFRPVTPPHGNTTILQQQPTHPCQLLTQTWTVSCFVLCFSYETLIWAGQFFIHQSLSMHNTNRCRALKRYTVSVRHAFSCLHTHIRRPLHSSH